MFLEIPTFYARMFFLHATGVTVVQKKTPYNRGTIYSKSCSEILPDGLESIL